MTRDEIIKMAHESGLVSDYKQYDDWIEAGPSGEDLITFAKLVAAKEREACAKVCEDREEQWRKAGFFKDVHEFREMAFYIRARGKA